MSEPVSYHVEEAVATISLTRPDRLNSLDLATKEALLSVLREAAADSAVRCVVLTGTGTAFCVGQDLREHRERLATLSPEEVWKTVDDHYTPIARAITEMAKPVIAAINGVAAGAGFSIALACDLRIAADVARFNSAFTAVGLSCDTGSSWTLPRLVGPAVALDLLLRPRTLDAEEAQRLGLVSEVVRLDDLSSVVSAIAVKLAAGPTLAYASVKASVAFAATHSLAESLTFESRMMARTGASEDHRRAVESFVAKEKPSFGGR